MIKDAVNTFFVKRFGPSRSAAQQIIATCVLVFLLAWLIILITLYPTSNRIVSQVLLDWLKFSPLELSQGFKFLSPFTYMFLHLNAWHLLGNMLWLYFVGAILLTVYLRNSITIEREVGLSMGINSILGLGGYLLRFYSMANLDVFTYALLSNIGIVMSYVYGYLILHETMTIQELLGTVCIIVACFYAKKE
jgi:membrane associated rhomboid family serine protease